MKRRATPSAASPPPSRPGSIVEPCRLIPATETELESLGRLFMSNAPEPSAPRRVLRTGVEEVRTQNGPRFAIFDRSDAVAGAPREERLLGLFDDAATAGLVASALAAASTTRFEIDDHPEREGFALSHGGLPFGHVRDHDPGLPERIRLAHDYASNLHSLAQLVESLGAASLDFLGKTLARRAG